MLKVLILTFKKESNKMKNIFNNCQLYLDLDFGFAYAGKTEAENLFQVCLMLRKDGKGYKKTIKKSDSGYNDGICGDYNENLYSSNIENVYKQFIIFARKKGVNIL